MKSMTTKLMMTAAALAIATGVASAQQYRADIPFAFRVGNRTMSPGQYSFQVKGDQHYMVKITNARTLHSMLLLPASHGAAGGKVQPAPVLTFVCGTSRCSLAKMWTGASDPALTFSAPRSGKDEHASATEIRMVKLNGD